MIKPLIEIITVGLPFCAFKIITGAHFGFWPLLALGLIDLAFNSINLLGLLFTRRMALEECFFSYASSLHARLIRNVSSSELVKWRDLGNSIDMLVSFSIVAFIIGGGFIIELESAHLNTWNISVVFNVFGAGYSRLSNAIYRLR